MIIRNRTKAQKLSLAAAIFGVLEAAASSRATAATLPVPCLPGGGCSTPVTNRTIDTWVTSGTASYVQFGNNLTVNQTTDRAIFNWQSFNISADGTVTFKQPDSNSIALNKIFDKNPSEIFGKLEANGQLYLINQNGFLFGATSRINTGGLLVSSLNIDDNVFKTGLLSTARTGDAAMKAETEEHMATILVEPGAQLTTNATGQRILLAAKTIDNQGNITANEGQVILAAGEKVYVTASDDPQLRGLLVEVDAGGTVINTGTVTAARGNITAVGLAVNQNGRMSATTSVAANGSIRLLARDTTGAVIDDLGQVTRVATKGGELRLGSGSVTEVNPDAGDTTTAVKEQRQFASSIELMGQTIEFAGGSRVAAAGGNLSVVAATNVDMVRDEGVSDPDARIRVDSGAIIDMSGSTATASVTRNLVTVELRANELADSPEQRDGPLRGKTVVVDARVLTANGNRGTDVGNVQGAIDLIGQDVLERTAQGGTATFDSAGDIVVAKNAVIDVSGGAVKYEGGMMRTSQVIKSDGTVLDIGKASKDEHYVGLLNPVYKYVSDRWGVIKYINAPGLNNYESGYVGGADAGTIQFMGNAMVLAGNFLGNATNGSNQRTKDTMALGGQLIVGVANPTSALTSFRAPTINIVSSAVPVVVGEGTSLPAGLPLYLSTDFISQGGFSRLQFASDSRVAVARDTKIDLPAGGSLALVAPRVEIKGDISVPAGAIKASAINNSGIQQSGSPTGLFVDDGVAFDVRGQWINDAVIPLDQQPTGMILTKGGEISLSQSTNNGTLQIGNDVALHASGGAWLKRSGAISGGSGGSIAIGSASNISSGVQRMNLGENLQIDGFGVQGAAGGTFSMRAPRVEIVTGDSWLAAQQLSTSATDGGALQVGSPVFSDSGFANFSFTADNLPLLADDTNSVLRVKPGTEINLSPQTLLIDDASTKQVSGLSVTDLATATYPVADQMRAATLKMQVTTAVDNPRLYGALRVDGDITGNAGSTVNLVSDGNLRFDGAIDIAGGKVGMSIAQPATQFAQNDIYLADRQLAIGDTAIVDVSGARVLRPNVLGLELGNVIDGGSIALNAARGSIDIKLGSVLDISGTEGELDIQRPGSSSYEHRLVSSVAGSISIQAAESIAMQGELRARGGVSDDVQNTGGSLSVALARVPPSVPAARNTYPTNPRVVELVKDASATPANGVASIDAEQIAQSGIETLVLQSDDRVAIGAGVDLHLKRSAALNAPQIAVLGEGNASISATNLSIGSDLSPNPLPIASTGTGTLQLTGDQISFRNLIVLQNIRQTTVSSSGDIQFSAYQPVAQNFNLSTLGNLTLRAQRVLPTTRSEYIIKATGEDSVVSIEQLGSSPGVPMSVAGSLTITAPNIVQGGTLLAPFGSLNLNATKSLQLLNGSYTSVSGNNAVLPYGRVDNGNAWVWGLDSNGAQTIEALPRPRITLNGTVQSGAIAGAKGADVVMAAGAVVDVSGGGDLLAYQYTPGTNGKLDVLDPLSVGYLKDTYAIVPTTAQSVAFDPLFWNGSSVTPGQSIFIAEGSDVPAGVYQLLPARYAFVSGAYLVTAVFGYQDLTQGSTAITTDGATVVAGYYTFGSEQNAAARSSGFAIRPGSYARKLAQYEDRLASNFFASRAEQTETRTTLPADAGTLVVSVDKSLQALASVRGQGATGGRNATVEIAMSGVGSAIEIDGANANATTSGSQDAGVVHLSGATLKSWNVGSLLVGGTRNSADAVSVKSDNVVVHSGASLSADEVVLVASKAINVESGASVRSNSDGQPGVRIDTTGLSESTSLKLTGANAASAAVLAVSDLNYLVTERDVAQSNAGATITVASGAHVGTRGAVAVDSSGVISLATNSIAADGASWSLGATHVAFGDAGTAADRLAIDNSLQANLQTARAINLSSAQTLDITRSVELGSAATESITLKTAGIQNTGANTNSVFTAKDIVLNGVNAHTNSVAPGTGGIVFNAQRIELGKGEIGLSGFESASLNATGVITGTDIGGLVTAGNLSLSGAAITAASGAQTTLKAEQGAINLSTVGAAPNATTLKTGGTLSFSGRDIDNSAHIIAPSGVVSLRATNTLSVREGATIDVAGYRPPLAATGSNGGAVTLAANNLSVASGTTVNVSAGPQADAGSIIVVAGATNLAGTMSGVADGGFDGGEFALDAQSLTDFAALNRTLEQGGFTDKRSYRIRTGDIALASSDRITAQQIELTADAGSVVVDGRMLATSNEQRGSIAVNARNNVVIGGTAVLDASAVDVSHRGGSIELATTGGIIRIAPTASIRATGTKQSGSLILRAPKSADDFYLDSLPTDLSKVDSLILQPIFSATLADNPTSAEFNAIGGNINTYISGSRTNILNRLDLSAATNVYLRPYADLTRVGDLTLSEFDFSSNTNTWRFAGQPAVVSIRATGNLNVAAQLSDGFSAVQSGNLLGTSANPEYSSAFNFVAGADLTSASMTATDRNSIGDLSLSDAVIVRTGTGDISLAAARDIVIGAGATVYTGGIPGADSLIDDDGTNIYPDKGGSVRLNAGRDVSGSVVQQVVGEWQSRWAYYDEPLDGKRVAYWGVDVNRFGWNFGTLGGGDINIVAGRNAIDVSAAVVDTAADSSGTRLELGGGNLSVTTGNDIESGYFYVAHGLGDLRAWGAFSSSGNRPSAPTAGTLLIAGDTSYKLAATGDILFEGEGQASVFTPIWPSLFNDSYIYFSRYRADSALTMQSSGGNIEFRTSSAAFADFGADSDSAFIIYPASLYLSAFGGDFNQRGSFLMSPSTSGNLVVYAARDINTIVSGINMSDVAADSLAGLSPTYVAGNDDGGSNFAFAFKDYTENVLHKEDALPSAISAGRDINNLSLNLSEAVELSAGRDIKNLSLDTQQAGVATVSKISAGRDFYYTYTPDALTLQVRAGGTGLLELLAGRKIDLAFSLGITTSGNLLNGNLPSGNGASIFAIASLNQPLGTGEFVADIVHANADLKPKFVTYVEQQTGRQNLDFDTARPLYSALPATRQLPFAIDALFQELVASGREATSGSPAGYSRGFESLASLFPNNLTGNETYSGDISLPFSRIYTLQGGSITLMAPGGKIDVGLANTPSLANVNNNNRAELERRKASLGIVAQQAGEVHILADGDVLVNTSRIFTLGGGDIAIWSSTGNIDAGKGAKSAITAPPPTLTIDAAGNVSIDPGSAIAGSGIRTIRTTANTSAANVDLMAPTGFVNAGDAGIGSSGNLNIAAQSVVGLDNIQVGGKSSGVPAETGGLGASLSGVTATAGNATTNAANSIGDAQAAEKTSTVLADAAMSWLEVFVVGLGEDSCKQDDIECLKRQK